MDSSIHISGVSKRYSNSGVIALRDINLDIAPGELFGIIGPDGAGKTTLFRILATLLLPDSGAATVCGYDIIGDYRRIRKVIGYMPGRFSLYHDLTVEENLRFFATVFNTTPEENYHLIRDIYVQLEPFKTRRAGKLSGGMKQKLALCCALVHEPALLLLDEPTTGVDPVSRTEFWGMLDALKRKGITVVVSTPYMDEAARCDRIALIQDGALLDVDRYQGILETHKRPVLAVRSNEMFRLLGELRAHPACASCYSFGSVHHVTLHTHAPEEVAALRQFLLDRGHTGLEIQETDAGIEDIFIDLMTTTT
jgi:ABC-type multidrug transport system ATPase subunit